MLILGVLAHPAHSCALWQCLAVPLQPCDLCLRAQLMVQLLGCEGVSGPRACHSLDVGMNMLMTEVCNDQGLVKCVCRGDV